MGRESRLNPLSTQFETARWKDLPRLKLGAKLETEIVPSAGWLAENPVIEGQERPSCPPHRAVVRTVYIIEALFPNRFKDAHSWAKGEAAQGLIDEKPLVDVLRNLQAVNPHLTDAIVSVLTEAAPQDDEKAAEPAVE